MEDPEENICMSSIETIVTLKSLERVTKAVRNIIDKVLAEERITPEEGIILYNDAGNHRYELSI